MLIEPASNVSVPFDVVIRICVTVEAVDFEPVAKTIIVPPLLAFIPVITQLFPDTLVNVNAPDMTLAAAPSIDKNPEVELPFPLAEPP